MEMKNSQRAQTYLLCTSRSHFFTVLVPSTVGVRGG